MNWWQLLWWQWLLLDLAALLSLIGAWFDWCVLHEAEEEGEDRARLIYYLHLGLLGFCAGNTISSIALAIFVPSAR